MRPACKGFLLVVFLCRFASAETVTVHVAPADPDAIDASVTLRAVAPSGDVRDAPLKTGVDTPVDLPWSSARLEVVAPGYWSAAVSWSSGDTRRVVVPLWPAGEVTGRVVAQTGLDVPKQLSVRVTVPRETGNFGGVSATTPCAVAAAEFRCAVPAAKLDLKVEAADFVPHYFWSVAVERASPHSLGTLHLRPGASVVGWVATAAPGSLPRDVAVALKPVAHAAAEESANARVVRAGTTERGFFQFRGVPAGTYTIEASGSGWSAATSDQVTVDEGREYEHRTPLMLAPLANLRVLVQPARSAGGGAWVVKLDRPVPFSNYYRPVASEAVDDTGAWMREGLQTGQYRLLVTDPDGSVFARRTIELPHDDFVTIEVTAVAVRGQVTLAELPLESDLLFSDASGKAVRLKTDAEGRFTGTLPSEGRWAVRVAPRGRRARIDGTAVDVRRASGEDVAEVEIRLPGGTIRGRVVDEQGRGVVADVAAFRDGRVAGQAASEASGRFEIAGLPPGEFRLEAETAQHDGEAAPVNATADGPEVRIVLRTARATSGWLTDDRGHPVAGALLRYGVPGATLRREAVSGPSGEFEINLPPGAVAEVVVLAPGFPAKLTSVTLPVRARERVDVVLTRASGTLTIRLGNTPPWPYLHGGDVSAPLPTLFLPTLGGPPPGLAGAGFTVAVEPGTYRVCGGRRPDERCAVATVHAGSHATLDARPVHGTR